MIRTAKRSAPGDVALVLPDVARAAGARAPANRPGLSARAHDRHHRRHGTRPAGATAPRACKFLRERILGPRSAPLNFSELAQQQGSPAEKLLLEKIEDSLALLQTLSPADLKLVRDVLTTITSGQELDLRRFASASAEKIIALETAAELDDYTYRVAGCVGEFWTKICRAHLFPNARLDEKQFITDGIRFGKGLQLVNILRDLPADLKNGRCYLPTQRLDEAKLAAGNFAVAGERGEIPPAVPRISRPRRNRICARAGVTRTRCRSDNSVCGWRARGRFSSACGRLKSCGRRM